MESYLQLAPMIGSWRFSTVVEGLSEGWHTINVTVSAPYRPEGSASVIFMVDTVASSISVLLPQNKTYTTTDMFLNFTASEVTWTPDGACTIVPPEWIGYSLDGQRMVTITGNTTLLDLSFGTHNLTIYANDTTRNLGTSDAVYFAITQETEGEPRTFPYFSRCRCFSCFPSVVAIGVKVYFKKRKHKGLPSPTASNNSSF